MKYSVLSLLGLPLLFASCGDSVKTYPDAVYAWEFDSAHANVAQFVDPFIGTGGHGHTFPGATAPFGMVQLSPDTRIDGSWDGCSGYHHDDHRIYGFSHTHLSGTGCSDYGDIMFMPGSGQPFFTPGSDTTAGYSSTFTHEMEQASAGYYSVKLDNNVMCELTASPRVGVHRYNFNDQIDPWIVLDMSHRDEVLECDFEVVDDYTIRGKRFSKAWATNQQLWFYAEFSEPFTWKLYSEGKEFTADSAMPKDLKVVLSFTAQQVEVK
jgi:putative alpha-1,2-mannosidase